MKRFCFCCSFLEEQGRSLAGRGLSRLGLQEPRYKSWYRYRTYSVISCFTIHSFILCISYFDIYKKKSINFNKFDKIDFIFGSNN